MNQAAMGPRVNDAVNDRPDPKWMKPSSTTAKPSQTKSKKAMLPRVSKPVETWPERSYVVNDRPDKIAQSVNISLNDLMASKEQAATDTAAEDAILLRLYEYIHEKMSTLKATFQEFDRDGSGAIDEEELYYALRHLGFMVDFGECKSIINSIERRAAEIEHKFHSNHKAYTQHMKAEQQLVGTLSVNAGGYNKHVDGKVDYKELAIVMNATAKKKGVLRSKSRFSAKGALQKRTPGRSILQKAGAASKIKGVRGIQGLNSLYRTHARITGKVDPSAMVNVEELDVIGPILPVEALEADEYGLLSNDNLLYPVRKEAAEDCKALLAALNRIVAIDADSSTAQRVAELIEGLSMDDSQLHKNSLAQFQGDMLTLLVAASQVENLRLFIGAVKEVLQSDVRTQKEIGSMQELVTDSFAMDMPALDWHKMEQTLAGVGTTMDTFWYARCAEEFEAEDDIDSCKGMWKQIYAELRFQRHLRLGVDQVNETEMVLWDNFIGALVQTVDLSETGCRDDTVAVAVAYCPHIKYLDLHDTKVTDNAIGELVSHLAELVWINIEDTAITGDGVEKLVQTFPNLELVG